MMEHGNMSEQQIWAQYILRKGRSDNVEKVLRAALEEICGNFTQLRELMLEQSGKDMWREVLIVEGGLEAEWKRTFFGFCADRMKNRFNKDNGEFLNQNIYFVHFGELCIEWLVNYLADRLWDDKAFRAGEKASNNGSTLDLGNFVGSHLNRAFPEAKVYACLKGAGALPENNYQNLVKSTVGFLSAFRFLTKGRSYEDLQNDNLIEPLEMAKAIKKERALTIKKDPQSEQYILDALTQYYGCAGKASDWPTIFCGQPYIDNPFPAFSEAMATKDADTRISELIFNNMAISIPRENPPTSIDGLQTEQTCLAQEETTSVFVTIAQALLLACFPKLKNTNSDAAKIYRNGRLDEFNDALKILKESDHTNLPKQYRLQSYPEMDDQAALDLDELAKKWISVCVTNEVKRKHNIPVSGDVI